MRLLKTIAVKKKKKTKKKSERNTERERETVKCPPCVLN